jgi:hypothetical protein
MRADRRGSLLLLVTIVCCSCASPYERLREDALEALECDNSRLMLERPSFLDSSTEFSVIAACYSGRLDLVGPGPGMPQLHVTAWAKYACPSHETLNSLRGYLFRRCERVAQGVGDPPL